MEFSSKSKGVDLADEDVTEELHIDRTVYSRLIGHRGKSIRKFMDRFHVLVRFPSAKETDDTVMMIGKEENVKVAKKFILEVAHELAERDEEKELCDVHSGSSSSRFQLKDFIVGDAVDKLGAPRQKHA